MLREKYLDKRPDLFDPRAFTWENYLWAFINIFSRAIRVQMQAGETIIMCPYADLINHNPFANTYIVAERPFRPLNPIRGPEVITIYADKDYKKMEQVYISYGPKSNADLLLLYGFCMDRNPFNSVGRCAGPNPLLPFLSACWVMLDRGVLWQVDITVSLSPEDPLYEKKSSFLRSVERREVESFPLYADRYPNELFEYLRLVSVSPEELGSKQLQSLDYADPISKENELRVLTLIEEACKQALQRYPTTEEEDGKLVNDVRLFKTLSKRQRMAVKHRRSEKRLLKKTAAAVRQQTVAIQSGRRQIGAESPQ
jgi:hypothetical protein